MKLLGFLLAMLALVFAVVSGMSVGEKTVGLHEAKGKAGCGGGGGPPPPPPSNSTG